ncbi:hypothetical protein SUGI_0727300 [Cryptomeria japonica]|nr:hypothetical protein SUGI_0727300 [Cryptomeria japonica]
MPPTTGLAFQTDKRYHVFLSFRGPDVRNTLVAHLYQALSAAGLNVFLDSDKLEKGEVIELSLETVIERSAIRIPIFSTGYANSAWCLKEAASMLKYPGLIIPLFYAVDPVDVRYPSKNSSPYKQSFLKHYSHSDQYPREEIEWWKSVLQHICPCLNFGGHSVRYPRREIDSWKDALQEISSRSGWSMDITQGVTLEVAKHPVGLDSVKNALIQKLNLNSVDDVIKIGIWGIGGIDETGLIRLQREVLRDLCNYDGEVYSVLQGKSLFKDRLRGKLVLLSWMMLMLWYNWMLWLRIGSSLAAGL